MNYYSRALLLFALLVAACSLAPAESQASTRYRGVQLHSLWESGSYAEMDRELDMVRDMGANAVRVDVGWSSLETGGKGEYSPWFVQKLDRLMAGADSRGIKVIATLWSTPCWASTAPESKKQGCEGDWWNRGVTMYPPTDSADYADAARWITARYGTKLAALEVWNEPNLPEDRFWIAQSEPLAYANLLKAAYPAAKQGNAAVPVLAGALAYNDPSFLTALYAAGIKGSYDGLAVHPYQGSNSLAGGWSGMDWIRNLKRIAGDTTPIWVTEFGWSTCNSGHGACVSPEQQGEYTAAGFAALDGMGDVEAGIVYNLRAKGSDAGSFEDNFGLVDHDFTPKPGYEAVRRALGGQGRSSVRPASPRVRLSLRRRGGAIVAIVRGPRRARVRLRVFSCPRAPARRVSLRTGRRGVAKRRLGSRTRLAGCHVSAGLLKASAGTARLRVR